MGRLNGNESRAGRTDDLEIRHANHLVEDIGVARGDPIRIQATDLEGEDALQFPINDDLPTWARFQTNDVLPTLARAPIDADLPNQVMEGNPELGGSHLKQFQTIIRGFLETIVAPVTILDFTPTADLKRHRAIRNLRHRTQSHSARLPRGPRKMGEVTDGDLRRVTIHQTRDVSRRVFSNPGDVRIASTVDLHGSQAFSPRQELSQRAVLGITTSQRVAGRARMLVIIPKHPKFQGMVQIGSIVLCQDRVLDQSGG